jgi:hypothetical protein
LGEVMKRVFIKTRLNLLLLCVVCIAFFASYSLAADINPKVAIVFSNTSYYARNSTSETEGVHYLYEVSTTEHQLMMAGIPFDIIGENNLTSAETIGLYNVIILPAMSNVRSAIKDQILNNLETAVKSNGLNIYAIGDLMVANEAKVKFNYSANQSPINRILNVKNITGKVDASVTYIAVNSSNPATWRYNNNESLFAADWFGYTKIQVLNATEPATYPFQAYDTTAKTFNPVTIATKNRKGRIFYASDATLSVETAIGRDAILWLIYEDKPHFGIKITNKTAIFIPRVDADDSGDIDINIPAINNYINITKKNRLLGGWYITTNNGGNTPVDWATLRPYYQKMMNNSIEIGSHSVTHYDDINLQTDAVVYNEFLNSKQQINTQLGINITGYANAGNTPLQLRLWRIANQTGYSYYSPLQDSKYKGFGYVSDQFTTVNIETNMISDYELMDIQKLTDVQTANYWKGEFNTSYRWGDGIVICVLWHDYLLNSRYNAYFTFASYVNQTDTEGTTPNDVVQRFINWTNQDFTVNSIIVNGSEAWSITRLSPRTKFGQITVALSTPIRGFSGTSHLSRTPDNKSYVFAFEADTVTFYFNSTGPSLILNPIGNKTVSENSTLNFNLTVVYNGTGTISYQKNSSLGTLNGAAFTWTPPFGSNGLYAINFTATDGTAADRKTAFINVLKTNRAPVLQHINDISVNEGQIVRIIPNATDSDGDAVTYLYSAPLNQTGGWQTHIGDAGIYSVNVTATDGNLSVSQGVLIIVASALSVNITLVSGWNLISIPIVPADSSISAIMNGCSYTRIWEFEPNQSWKSTDTGLTMMDNMHGYFIDRIGIPGSCTISIQGANSELTQISLNPQWTLVGFPSQSSQLISYVIAPSMYSKIWEFLPDQSWKSTDTGLVNFTPGKGYWIDSSASGFYNVTSN